VNKPPVNPPVNFEQLVKENAKTGDQDEMRRIREIETLKSDMDTFKRQARENERAKEQEVRALQAAMGEMRSENAQLCDKNESKPSVLDGCLQKRVRNIFERKINS
jgi:hypothetical protein